MRPMALATLVNTTGNGIFFTLSALYFTRIVGFSVVEVGTGLSIAASVAIFARVPIGHLADRRGPRGPREVMSPWRRPSGLSHRPGSGTVTGR
ncbi:MAG: hypothetical protein JWO11_2032 [Nocardioides sp.]|nr:hypothetical protein [Nocardioides sp.]